MLAKALDQFQRIDSTIASSTLKEQQLHFWHLTKEMVPFCVFDGCVAYAEKEKNIETLIQGKGHRASVARLRYFLPIGLVFSRLGFTYCNTVWRLESFWATFQC